MEKAGERNRNILYKNERKLIMSRPTTKTDLLTAAAANYEKLNTFVKLGTFQSEWRA